MCVYVPTCVGVKLRVYACLHVRWSVYLSGISQAGFNYICDANGKRGREAEREIEREGEGSKDGREVGRNASPFPAFTPASLPLPLPASLYPCQPHSTL